MGTKFAVVGSNLVVAYKKIKIFALFPHKYPQQLVDFLLAIEAILDFYRNIHYTFAKRFQPKLDKNKDLEKNNFYEDMQC